MAAREKINDTDFAIFVKFVVKKSPWLCSFADPKEPKDPFEGRPEEWFGRLHGLIAAKIHSLQLTAPEA